MAFIVIADGAAPFKFDGKIAGDGKRMVFHGQSTHVFRHGAVQAILREDFFEEYTSMMKDFQELRDQMRRQN